MAAVSSGLPLDWTEQVARIERAQEEARKFAAEQHKLSEEATKLAAEAKKLDRERRLAPLVIVTSVLSSLGTGLVVYLLTHFFR